MPKRKKSAISGSLLSLGLLVFTTSLIVAGIYLIIRSNPENIFGIGKKEINEERAMSQNELSGWERYKDEEFGYVVSYPQILEPKTIQSDVYLRFIIFFAPQGVMNEGFALSVRENSLDEEVELIKGEIGKDIKAKLVKEEKIKKGKYLGRRIEYEPENLGTGVSRVVVIIDNGRFSYTISSTPGQIDKIVSTFELL